MTLSTEVSVIHRSTQITGLLLVNRPAVATSARDVGMGALVVLRNRLPLKGIDVPLLRPIHQISTQKIRNRIASQTIPRAI
jgi:hypothetical protein